MGVINEATFSFPALRGIQAGREYYTIMCPLKYVPKLFSFNEEEIDPRLRAQRVLNKSRIPEMKEYLLKNDYIFSSLTVSIDGDIKFIPAGDDKDNFRIGNLFIPMDAKILVNDGQHRRAAISEAIKENPQLGYETISVVIFPDRGLKASQQMFCDLNKYAVKPNNSLNMLYNNRDEFSQFVVDMLFHVEIFNDKTEMEKTSISNRSTKVFTLNIIGAATKNILGIKSKNIKINDEDKKKIIEFWKEVEKNMKQWQDIIKEIETPYTIRENYICTHGIVLEPLGNIGYKLLFKNGVNKNWREILKNLQKINWSRNNEEFKDKAIVHGKISKTKTSINLVTELIEKKIGIKR